MFKKINDNKCDICHAELTESEKFNLTTVDNKSIDKCDTCQDKLNGGQRQAQLSEYNLV